MKTYYNLVSPAPISGAAGIGGWGAATGFTFEFRVKKHQSIHFKRLRALQGCVVELLVLPKPHHNQLREDATTLHLKAEPYGSVSEPYIAVGSELKGQCSSKDASIP